MTNYPILDAQLADGPQGAWSLQETSGTSMADVSGNGRNGAYANVTFNEATIFPPAARSTKFTSTTAKGELAYAAWMNSNEWTVEIAAYPSDVSGTNTLVSRDDNTNRVFSFRLDAGRLYAACWNASGTLYECLTTAIVSANTAYLFAVRWKSGELSIWKDGVKVKTTTTTGNAKQPTNGKMWIGNYVPGTYNYPFKGNLSHAAFYNTALSDARLLAHAASTPDANITAPFTQENLTLSVTQTIQNIAYGTAAFTQPDLSLAVTVESMDANISAAFTQEDLVFGARASHVGDVENTAPFELEELTMFGAINGVQIVEASENYIVEDVVFAMVPQYVDIYEVTAAFTVENFVLEADNDADTPITPDPFSPTLIDVQMFCLIQALPPYDLPPGGLLTYDGSEYLIEADTGWEPAI